MNIHSRNRGNCRICWSTAQVSDFDISLGAAKDMMKGKIDTCCGYGAMGKNSNFDCVQIPSATKSKTVGKSIANAMGFCGQAGLFSEDGKSMATDAKKICCKLEDS